MSKPQRSGHDNRGHEVDRVVLGKHPERIQEALDHGGVFFDPGELVLARLTGMGIDRWRLEEAFLRQQEAAGRRFEHTLRGFSPDETVRFTQALPLLAEGKLAEALRELQADTLPSYAQEAQWLLNAGYAPDLEDLSRGVIRWVKP